jgi:hypothetical protein
VKKFEKHLQLLNALLYTKPFDRDAFCWQINILRNLGNCNIAVYDFVYHNEARMLEARRKKGEALSRHEYKEAVAFCDIEKACEDYLAFRRDYPGEKSMFELIGSQPSYIHFGNAPNDKEVMEALTGGHAFPGILESF